MHDRVSAVVIELRELDISFKRLCIIHAFVLNRIAFAHLCRVVTVCSRHCRDVQQQTIDRVTTIDGMQTVVIDIRLFSIRQAGDDLSSPHRVLIRDVYLLFRQVVRQHTEYQRDDRIPTLCIRDSDRIGAFLRQVLEQVIRIRLSVTGGSGILIIAIILTCRFHHLNCVNSVVMRLRVVSCHHVEIRLIRRSIVSDEHVRTFCIGSYVPRIVFLVRQYYRCLTVIKRNHLALERHALQTIVINHLHIVQIDVILTAAGARSTTRCGIRSESHQHVCRLIRRDGVIGKRHGQTLPVHRRSSRIIYLRIAYLNRRVIARLRILIAGIGRDDCMRTRFVGHVRRVSIRRDIFRPKHQRVRLTRKSRVIAAVGRVGEVIVLGSVGSRRGTGIDLSVGAVTVRLGTQHRVRLQAGTVRTGRTRTGLRALRELIGVTAYKICERTGSRSERVPAGRFVIRPVTLETTVNEIVVPIRRLCREDERGLRDIDPHLIPRHTRHGVGFCARQEIYHLARICRAVDGQRAVIDTRLRSGTQSLRNYCAEYSQYCTYLLHYTFLKIISYRLIFIRQTNVRGGASAIGR